MGIESSGAGKLAKPASGSGGLAAIAKGWLTGKYLSGEESSKGARKTAADWQNEEVSKQKDYGRQVESEERRRGYIKEDQGVTKTKAAKYTPSEASWQAYPQSSPTRTRAANTSGGGQGTSGNVRGKQLAGVGEKKTSAKRVSGKPPAAAKTTRTTRATKPKGSGEMLV